MRLQRSGKRIKSPVCADHRQCDDWAGYSRRAVPGLCLEEGGEMRLPNYWHRPGERVQPLAAVGDAG
jgi:hypothetical protein